MPPAADTLASPADTSQQPHPAECTGSPRGALDEVQARLAHDIEVDRKVLEHLLADHNQHARQVADMEAKLEAIKRQGIQLVKQLQAARRAVGAQSQTIAQLKERIALAERSLDANMAGDERVGIARSALSATAAVISAKTAATNSVPSDVPPPEGHQTTPISRPPAMIEEGDCAEDSPLIGQLLDYQTRQWQAGRWRRIFWSLLLLIVAGSALTGLALILMQLFGQDAMNQRW